jgi:Phosphoglycerol transferase and related proteins, alkaline phosphatase superfamily
MTQQLKTKLKRKLTDYIHLNDNWIILVILWTSFLFWELLFYYFCQVPLSVSKVIINTFYCLLFSQIIYFIKWQKTALMVIVFMISVFYFAQASYFNIFKSFALWSHLLNIKELAGLGDGIKDFIVREKFLFFLPLLISLIFTIWMKLKKNHSISESTISKEDHVALLFISASLLAGFSLSIYFIGGDANKMVIRSTKNYLENYGLVDAVIVNGFQPVLSKFFNRGAVGEAEIKKAFTIEKSVNEMTDIFKDKSVVFIQAESVAPFAIDERLTPTLYKLQQTGIYFDNFYGTRLNTFASEYAIMNSFYLTPEKQAIQYTNVGTMPTLFKELGYTADAFHNFPGHYYDRENKLLELGFDNFYATKDLDIKWDSPNFNSDIELFEKAAEVSKYGNKSLNYYITLTGHGGYNIETRPLLQENFDIVKRMYPEYDETIITYLAAVMHTDKGLEHLLANLEQENVMDDTVIILVGDHFPYVLGETIRETFPNSTQGLDLYKVPFIIWDNGKNVDVRHDVMSNVDILPTMANMFGLALNYGMGVDVYNPNSLAIAEWHDIRNFSFLTKNGGYDGNDVDMQIKLGNLSDEELEKYKQLTVNRDIWNNSEFVIHELRKRVN